jgi:hypothetical protein
VRATPSSSRTDPKSLARTQKSAAALASLIAKLKRGDDFFSLSTTGPLGSHSDSLIDWRGRVLLEESHAQVLAWSHRGWTLHDGDGYLITPAGHTAAKASALRESA